MIYTVTPAPNAFIGVQRHLQECEQFGTKHIYIKDISKVTEKDTVIFGAWEPTTYPMAIRRCKAKNKCLLFTSPLLQAQMNPPELEFLNTILQLKQRGVIDHLFFADQETYAVFRDVNNNIQWFPHPCNLKKMEKKLEEKKLEHNEEKEGIFCYMPWGNKNKNQANQLAAMKIFQKKIYDIPLQVNGFGQWKNFADTIKLKYNDVGFLEKNKYYNSMFTSKMGLHVTLSESFGYSVLDAFLMKTPVMCSPAIDWAPVEVITENPDNPHMMASDIYSIYQNHEKYGCICKDSAIQIIKEHNKIIKKFLKQFDE